MKDHTIDNPTHIKIFRPVEFGNTDVNATRVSVLDMKVYNDELFDMATEEVAEKMFHVTNAPEELLKSELEILLWNLYKNLLNPGTFHSMSVGDRVEVSRPKEATLCWTCMNCGWRKEQI